MRCVPLSIAPKSQTRGISRRRHIFFLPSWGAEAKQNTQGFSSRVSRRIQTSSKIFAPITADRVIIYFLFLPPSHARTAEARGLAGQIKSLYSTKPRKKKKKKKREWRQYSLSAWFLGLITGLWRKLQSIKSNFPSFVYDVISHSPVLFVPRPLPLPVILIHSLPSLENLCQRFICNTIPRSAGLGVVRNVK